MTSSHSHLDLAPRGIQAVVRLYPWSALWVLLAAMVVLVVEGSWTSLALVAFLILVVTFHAIHLAREDRKPR